MGGINTSKYKPLKKGGLIIALIIALSMTVFIPLSVSATTNGNKRAAIVMERDSLRILHAENEHEKMFMASTTKVVTAILALESGDVERKITVPKQAVGVEGSSIYLKENERITLLDLVYGLMLRSGNDSAVALALAVSGSLDKFAEKMNEFAAGLGCKNTNFVNPHGLHDDNHYTTAYDLGVMTSYAMRNPLFKQIVSTKLHTVISEGELPRHLSNKNKFLSTTEGANGVKTGFTKAAGRCLVSACERDGMQLIGVVLNEPDMWNTSKYNMETAFDNFSLKTVAKKGEEVAVIKDKGRTIRVTTDKDLVYPIKNDEKIQFKISESIPKRVYIGQKVGEIKITIDNRLIFKEKIYSMDSVVKLNLWDKIKQKFGVK